MTSLRVSFIKSVRCTLPNSALFWFHCWAAHYEARRSPPTRHTPTPLSHSKPGAHTPRPQRNFLLSYKTDNGMCPSGSGKSEVTYEPLHSCLSHKTAQWLAPIQAVDRFRVPTLLISFLWTYSTMKEFQSKYVDYYVWRVWKYSNATNVFWFSVQRPQRVKTPSVVYKVAYMCWVELGTKCSKFTDRLLKNITHSKSQFRKEFTCGSLRLTVQQKLQQL